jgi:hypothetical protein
MTSLSMMVTASRARCSSRGRAARIRAPSAYRSAASAGPATSSITSADGPWLHRDRRQDRWF